ncbi:MAG: phage tailspike protein, partial [Nitrosomonadaceae bacterium]
MTQNIVEIPIGYYGQFNQGRPLFNADIFVGVPDTDPEIPINQKQITLLLEDGTEVPVSQPVNTGPGGYISHNGSAATMFVEDNYSIKCLNSLGAQEYFFENVFNKPPSSGTSASRYDTVSDMDAANPVVGDFIDTSGYTSVGDDGDNSYEIVAGGTGTDDGGSFIDLSNGNQAMALFPKGIHSINQWGASNAGLVDGAAAIRAAIAYGVANPPFVLVGAAGNYKCDTGLGDYFASDLVIDWTGAIFDFSAIVGSYELLTFTGTSETPVALTANAASAQKTVAVTSASFAVGDFVKIVSTTEFDPRTNSEYGELNFIETVPDGVSVTTTMELMTAYVTVDSASIQKLNPVRNITVRGLTFQGPLADDNSKGIIITNGINCLIDNIQSYDVDAIHIQFFDCTFCRVVDSPFQESNAPTTGYGVSFTDACQDCSAENNVFTDVRHSLSTNNGADGGITRRILFQANIVTDSAQTTAMTGGDAIDTHSGAEDISIIDNIVNSSSGTGINVESRSATIIGNSVSNTAGTGIG